jgi:DNA-binding transcriptional LysR family regulator
LAQAHPRIRVELESPQNYLSLIENQTDMMVGFAEERHQDLTSVQMGTFHFVPFANRDYVNRKGMPTLEHLERHNFVDSARFSSKSAAWRPWRDLVERGCVTHSCDASITYSMMVKAGLGVGLLGTFNVIDPTFLPLDLDCSIGIPLFLTVLTERLQARPVRVVFDFVRSLLGPDNPWLAPEMTLDASRHTAFDEGYRALFNLY